MGPLGCLDFLRCHVLERQRDVDPFQNQHAILDLDFADGVRCQLTAARTDLTRFQRAAKCAEQSTASGRNHVIDRCRMRVRHVPLDSIMTRDWTMGAKPDGFPFRGHLRQT